MCNEPTPRRRRSARRGFSLVELIVVMVIIGMLASVVTLSTRSLMARSKRNKVRADIAQLSKALELFHNDHDRYPSSDEGLEVLTKKTDEQPDGYVPKLPNDPWDNPYVYNNPGRESAFEVLSLGADGAEGGTGTDTDISSEDTDS